MQNSMPTSTASRSRQKGSIMARRPSPGLPPARGPGSRPPESRSGRRDPPQGYPDPAGGFCLDFTHFSLQLYTSMNCVAGRVQLQVES